MPVSNLKPGHSETDKVTNMIYTAAIKAGHDVLLDDSADSAGAKLARMDLIGLPWQIVAGPRSTDRGVVELKCRKTGVVTEHSPGRGGCRIIGAFTLDRYRTDETARLNGMK